MSEAHKNSKQSFARDKVIEIISSVLNKVDTQEDFSRETIFGELQTLQNLIEETRQEIGATRPAEINSKFIPTATDELDAVVEATAGATGTIMDSCEEIETIASSLSGPESEKLSALVTKVYEACSFQDITGQRIKKVVMTLKAIESKVSFFMEALGDKSEDAQAKRGEPVDADKALLNGPQLPGRGINQDEIDKLLEQFD